MYMCKYRSIYPVFHISCSTNGVLRFSFLSDLSEEKTFVPYTEEMELPEEFSYHFITECFFLAHQAIRIAYSIVHKILKLHTSISRLQKISESAKEDKNYRIVALIQLQLGKGTNR